MANTARAGDQSGFGVGSNDLVKELVGCHTARSSPNSRSQPSFSSRWSVSSSRDLASGCSSNHHAGPPERRREVRLRLGARRAHRGVRARALTSGFEYVATDFGVSNRNTAS
jgi:hypothetical protein